MSSTVTEYKVDLLRFQPVNIKDIPSLNRVFGRFASRSCDYTIGGLLMWVEYFDYEIAFVEESLVIKGRNPENNELIFYAPCGNMDPDRFRELVGNYCKACGEKGAILHSEEITADAQIQPFEEYCITDWMEYLYEIEKFETFAGRKMEKKRNHLHFFLNNYAPFEVERISEANAAELISFSLGFDAMHDDSELARYECRQVIDVLRNFGRYPFEGIAVRKDGRIIGYAFGEIVGDTFFEHAEKGDIAYRGIYQFLASEISRRIHEKYPEVRYLNREEDMGDESLRLNKQSYHPALYICKKLDRQ